MARWWWPTLALAGFGAVLGFVLGHDHPSPGLSTRSLATIALAALVVVLLTLHRTAGRGPLARAVAEYAVVALLAALLAVAGGVDQPPTNPATSSVNPEARQAARDKPKLEAGRERRGVLRVAARVGRAVTKAVRAVTGAAGWLVDLWRQADAQTDHPHRPTTSTPTSQGRAMTGSPASQPSIRRLL